MQTTQNDVAGAKRTATDNGEVAPRIAITVLEPFVLKTPDGDISEEGVEDIQRWARHQSLPEIPITFDWLWITKRGTLPKRLQSFYYKEHGKKLSPDQISEIGNLGRRHSSDGKSFVLDFTNRFDWRAGDFGDGGSCFWGDRSNAREMLTDNGAFAVRAFRYRSNIGDDLLSYDNLRGYARAWLVEITKGAFVVFNGYGESALQFARLLALLWKCSYKSIGLTNNGDDGGTLYINGSNYAVGRVELISHIETHDFGWDELDRSPVCPNCGDEYDDDDGMFAEDYGGTVCADCASHCEDCECNYVRGVRVRDDGAWRCNACEEANQERAEMESEVS